MPDINDSLKRLKRVGSENSKTTEKLIEVAREISRRIVEMYAAGEEDMDVPANYFPGSDGSLVPTPVSFSFRIVRGQLCSYPEGSNEWAPVYSGRGQALSFAEKLANGLLDAVVDDIGRRSKQNQHAVEAIVDAVKDLVAARQVRADREAEQIRGIYTERSERYLKSQQSASDIGDEK